MQKEEIKKVIARLEEIFPNAKCELNYHNIYELCVAVILSAQTTDKLVNAVTPSLFKEFPTVKALAKGTEDEVKKHISRLGLANAKSKNLVAFAKKVLSDFNGEIPGNFDDLITLPGIGRKTANVVLSEGFKQNRIAVDTHVERTSKRLGLVSMDDSVLQVELKLMAEIDENKWHKTHHLLIFFGRYLCKAQNPLCDDCPFKQICTGYKKNKK